MSQTRMRHAKQRKLRTQIPKHKDKKLHWPRRVIPTEAKQPSELKGDGARWKPAESGFTDMRYHRKTSFSGLALGQLHLRANDASNSQEHSTHTRQSNSPVAQEQSAASKSRLQAGAQRRYTVASKAKSPMKLGCIYKKHSKAITGY